MIFENAGFVYNIFFPKERKLKGYLYVSLFFNFSFVLCSVTLPYLFKISIEFYEKKNLDLFVYLLLAYCAVWFFSRLLLSFREIFIYPVVEKSISHLYEKSFQHVMSLPYSFHADKSTGDLGGKIDMSINAFPNIIWPALFGFIPLMLELLISSAILTYSCGFEFGLGLLITILIISFFSFKASSKVQDEFDKANQSRLILQNKFIDGLLNFANIKIFGNFSKENNLINELSEKRYKINTKSFQNVEYLRIIQIIFLFFEFVFLFLMSLKKVVDGVFSLGDFIMVHAYLIHFTTPLEHYIEMFKSLNMGLSKIKYVADLLKNPIETNKVSHSISQSELSIEFKNIWFGYEKNKPILKGVSFKINPGEVVCLIGKTGEGKSTILKLILGFYKPWSGKILINGKNLEEINAADFLNNLSIIPQNNLIYNDSFIENIKRVLLNKVSKKSLNRALTLSLSDKILKKHKRGLGASLGENGLKLSGGEKQRIGFCRAFLKNANFWILDEATSALDKNTEAILINNLSKTYKNNLTSLIITHRDSFLKISNKVLQLKDGCIKERTTLK